MIKLVLRWVFSRCIISSCYIQCYVNADVYDQVIVRGRVTLENYAWSLSSLGLFHFLKLIILRGIKSNTSIALISSLFVEMFSNCWTEVLSFHSQLHLVHLNFLNLIVHLFPTETFHQTVY